MWCSNIKRRSVVGYFHLIPASVGTSHVPVERNYHYHNKAFFVWFINSRFCTALRTCLKRVWLIFLVHFIRIKHAKLQYIFKCKRVHFQDFQCFFKKHTKNQLLWFCRPRLLSTIGWFSTVEHDDLVRACPETLDQIQWGMICPGEERVSGFKLLFELESTRKQNLVTALREFAFINWPTYLLHLVCIFYFFWKYFYFFSEVLQFSSIQGLVVMWSSPIKLPFAYVN